MMQPAATNNDAENVRVVIVDDSSMTRFLMTEILKSEPGVEVVGAAADALEAREMIKKVNPDVITLDIEMPGMSGIKFLENLMRLRPMPVVMVSSLTEKGADVTLHALSLGAVDFVCKPKGALTPVSLTEYSSELIDKVVAAAGARVKTLRGETAKIRRTPKKPLSDKFPPDAKHSRQIIAIGASTGGTEAIRAVLESLPGDGPGIAIVQHITAAFNSHFVRRLDEVVPMRVCVAEDGAPILDGHAYVAPANQHLQVARRDDDFTCQLNDDAPENYHRPSVDVLFESVAKHAGSDAVGVILTGMGSDGARGMAALRKAGAGTIAQDERSSVVWGMPGAAVKLGGAASILPLDRIAVQLRKQFAGTS